jgi:hypothetical protein
MKKVAGVLILAVGCAHVEKTAFDTQSRTFQLCGNRWAGRSDFEKVAADSCNTPALLGCWQAVRGAMAQSYGNTAFAVPIHGTCCNYQCP